MMNPLHRWMPVGCLLALCLLAARPAAAQQIRLLEGHTAGVYGVVFSRDGKTMVTCGFDRTVKVWDRATGQLIRSIDGFQNPVLAVAVSYDGLLLASGGL